MGGAGDHTHASPPDAPVPTVVAKPHLTDADAPEMTRATRAATPAAMTSGVASVKVTSVGVVEMACAGAPLDAGDAPAKAVPVGRYGEPAAVDCSENVRPVEREPEET